MADENESVLDRAMKFWRAMSEPDDPDTLEEESDEPVAAEEVKDDQPAEDVEPEPDDLPDEDVAEQDADPPPNDPLDDLDAAAVPDTETEDATPDDPPDDPVEQVEQEARTDDPQEDAPADPVPDEDAPSAEYDTREEDALETDEAAQAPDTSADDEQHDAIPEADHQDESAIDVPADPLLELENVDLGKQDERMEPWQENTLQNDDVGDWGGHDSIEADRLSMSEETSIGGGDLPMDDISSGRVSSGRGGSEHEAAGPVLGPDFLAELGSLLGPQVSELKHVIVSSLQDSLDRESIMADAMTLG